MKRWIFFVFLFFTSIPAFSGLILRGTDTLGNQLIYDEGLDVTWYDFSPLNSWQNQLNWASTLAVDFGGTIFNDWRLPFADENCGTDFNCTSSEMAHLYYIGLNNLADLSSKTGVPDGIPLNTYFVDSLSGNLEYFLDLKDSYYWSGTEYTAETNKAWDFIFPFGYQFPVSKDSTIYALAVRNGDVGPSSEPKPEPDPNPVPEPSSLLLLSIGLGAVGLAAYQRKGK